MYWLAPEPYREVVPMKTRFARRWMGRPAMAEAISLW